MYFQIPLLYIYSEMNGDVVRMERLYEEVKKLFNIYMLSVFVIYISIFCSRSLIDYKSSLTLAVIIGILSIPVYIVGKKTDNYRILNPMFNSVAIGFSIGALYSYYDLNLELINMVLPILIIIDFAVINKLFADKLNDNKSKFYKWVMTLNIFVAFVAIVLSIIQWNNNIVLFSQIIFLALTHISYIAAVFLLLRGRCDIWFILSITYFSAFIVIFILVLCFIFESGDILEAFFEFDVPRNKKKNNKQTT